jgi:hypothetical protein
MQKQMGHYRFATSMTIFLHFAGHSPFMLPPLTVDLPSAHHISPGIRTDSKHFN